MNSYNNYQDQILERKSEGLNPLPIDGADLMSDVIEQIKDEGHEHREDSLNFFIYNVLPGTTSAAALKADFLKEIILGTQVVKEISKDFAFEQLSHMKGGPSIKVLLDLVLGEDESISLQAADVIKTQVFLYEADMERLEVQSWQRCCKRHLRKLCSS